MRWRDGKRSSNVEDRRNTSTRRHNGLSQGKRKAAGGGLGVLLIVLVGSYFGVDLSPLLNGLQQTNSLGNTQSAAPTAPSGQQDQRAQAVFLRGDN